MEGMNQLGYNTCIHGKVIMKLLLFKLSQTNIFFSKMKDRKVNGPCLGIGTRGRGEDIRKG
jgi:hypothetical protein